jgi:hypothetical protein
MDREEFARALAEALKRAGGQSPWRVDAAPARSFFLGLCVFLIDEEGKIDEGTIKILGRERAPLLPVFPEYGNGQGDTDSLLLISTEPRESGRGTREKAGRVVFWQPASVEARTEGLPPPPSTIPVYFIDPQVIEVAPTESILSRVGRLWGTAQFEGRPDLFRRVADEAAQVSGQEIAPVLGYLAGLLQSIRVASFSGADDLQPRPYAMIDLDTLGDFVNEYRRSTNQRTLDRRRIDSLQAWSCIPVPVQSKEVGQAPAHTVAFGPEWAEFLEEVVEQMRVEIEEEQDPPEAIWASAIRALTAFRQQMGRHPDDRLYPEAAPPDDSRWEDAYQRLHEVMAGRVSDEEETLTKPAREKLALFRLLLLLGVRIGPHVRWRWLNRVDGAEPFTATTRAISKPISQALFQGGDVPDDVLPATFLQSELMSDYRNFIALQPYHPLFSVDHAKLCRRDMEETGSVPAQLAAWIWFSDLADADLETTPFGGDTDIIDAFQNALVAAWPDISDQVLWTGWYCERWHSGRVWTEVIPSLAAFQLRRLPLWSAREDGRVPDLDKRRFPAGVMIAWEKADAPSATEPAAFLPMLDARDRMDRVATDLEVHSFGDLSIHGATLRLRWLLEASEIGDGPSGCWRISEFKGTSRDAWLATQYRLLSRIMLEREPDVLWNRRAVLTCGLALRAVHEEDQWAVPVIRRGRDQPAFARDVAFFQQTARRWEREKHAEKWILETNQRLMTALHRWAKALGAEALSREPPEAYKGTPVENEQAMAVLRAEVQSRLELILGTFQAHQEGNLNEAAETILQALETMYPVEASPDYTEEVGWSGLDEDERLVFSIRDYERINEEGQSGAAVLAEGLALLVGRTTVVGELQHALSAPEDQVRRLLRFRGVDLEAVIQQVTSLAKQRLELLLGRARQLIDALAAAAEDEALELDWRTDTVAEGERIAAIQELKDGRGVLAGQALTAMAKAAPDLPPASREDLLRVTLSEDPTLRDGIPLARRLLIVLRKGGWSASRRRRFLANDLVSLPQDLREHQEAVRAAVNRAVIAALVDRIGAGAFDGTEEPENELFLHGQALWDGVRVPLTALTDVFLEEFQRTLELTLDFEPGESLLVMEWDDEMWEELGAASRAVARDRLDEAPDEWMDLLEECLDSGSLSPLREHRHHQISQRQRRLRSLERRLQTGDLAFSPEALDVTEALLPLNGVESVTSEPGRGGGGRASTVTVNQAVRGRLAELFVLEVCWQRFRALGPTDRIAVLDAIALCRQDGPGDVPWSTATAWRKLGKDLSAHRDALIALTDDDEAAKLESVFKALIEVANEQGPGFDVLDPFGEWGADGSETITPRRVEIKAVLSPVESLDGHRVVLTTNEFHRARQDPTSYILRLVSVPREEDNVGNVRWFGDIADPVAELKLADRMVLGVRSGNLPFTLRWKR